MNCEQAFEAISAALDGELTPAEQAALSEHLEKCPHCRALAEDFGVLSAALEQTEQAPPPELARSVMEAVAADKSVPISAGNRRVPPWLRTLAAMLALVVCIGGAGLFLSGHGGFSQDSASANNMSGSAQVPTAYGPAAGEDMAAPQADEDSEADGARSTDIANGYGAYSAEEEQPAPEDSWLSQPEGDMVGAVAGAGLSREEALELAEGYLRSVDTKGSGGWTAAYDGLSANGCYYIFLVSGAQNGTGITQVAVPLDGGKILDDRDTGYLESVEGWE